MFYNKIYKPLNFYLFFMFYPVFFYPLLFIPRLPLEVFSLIVIFVSLFIINSSQKLYDNREYKPLGFCLFFMFYLVFLFLLVLILPSTPLFLGFKVHICMWGSILVLFHGNKWHTEWEIWRNPATAQVFFSLKEAEGYHEFPAYDVCFYVPNFSQIIRMRIHSDEKERKLRYHTDTITVHYNKENPDFLYLEI